VHQKCMAVLHLKMLSLMTNTRERVAIIQNGKIVGAVTHVLVSDPTRGYGIFIENMLEAAA